MATPRLRSIETAAGGGLRPSARPTTSRRTRPTGRGSPRAWRARSGVGHVGAGLAERAMARAQGRPDIETIIKDPGKYFDAPRDVVTADGFTRDEKRRILDSWALDAQLLAVAEEENMPGKDRPGLRDVK